MEYLKLSLKQVELSLENAKNNGDFGIVHNLEQERDVIKKQIEDSEQEQAVQLRVQTETKEIEYILDNLSYEGISMRELFTDEQCYQFGRIAIQTKMIEVVEKFTAEISIIQLQHKEFERAAVDRELQLKRQNDELQTAFTTGSEQYAKSQQEVEQLSQQLSHSNFERDEALSKRDAAMAKVDGLELLVSEKQAQIDILRQEAAVGAKNTPHIIDMETRREELKVIADQIKASRIHVYDEVADNVAAPNMYTAKRADTGEEITYSWISKTKYVVIKDAAEVEQFRAQHVQKSVLPDSTLVCADLLKVDVPTISDEQFRPGMGSVQTEQAVSQENTGDADIRGHAESVSGATVTAAQLEQRLQQFAQEHGLVKQAVA